MSIEPPTNDAWWRKLKDVSIDYWANGRTLAVVVHAVDNPLPPEFQFESSSHIRLCGVTVNAVAKALDAVLDGGEKYFSGGITLSDKTNQIRQRLPSRDVYIYGLGEAANMPLGSWLPTNFYAKAREIALQNA